MEATPSPYTALLPPLSEAEFADLKDDIAVRGVLVSVEVLPSGELLDGAVTNGDATAVSARLPRVSSRWRPVVLYRRPGSGPALWLPSDVITGNGRERELHR